MTQNQIAYLRLQEEIRSNKVNEAENQRSHMANEYIGLGTLSETYRHNVATEGLAVSNLEETVRHNKIYEAETERSNRANESLKHEANVYNREVGMAQVAESRRHNIATEEFNYYAEDHSYAIKSQQLEIDRNRQRVQEAEARGYFEDEVPGAKPGVSSTIVKSKTEQAREADIRYTIEGVKAGLNAIPGITKLIALGAVAP